MKRFFIYTLICSLTALMGCDKNDEVMNDLATTNGKKVTVTANIQGDAATRVTLTQDDADPTKPIVKVDWKASNETFKAYADGVAEPILFTQTADTEDSRNLFEGTLPETPAEYTLYYGAKDYDLSTQDGTLNEAYVLMQATTDFSTTIDFAHKTAILKPTFKVGDATLATNTISKIVMGGIKNPSAETESGSITVKPSALGDIYIFLPAFESYTAGHTFTFNVIAGGLNYQATLTIPDSRRIEAGKFYTADITIALAGTPYLTFTAQGEQTFKMNTEFEYSLPESLEYSVNNGEWIPVNTIVDPISFGGANGNLRLRGESRTGTAENDMRYSWIVFGNNTPVDCTGDIRTLVDYTDYENADTDEARFCCLFKGCSALTTAPALPATTLAVLCYFEMFRDCTSLTAVPATLPATTLAENCYQSMFYNCKALATAPTLPATTLAASCYHSMFYGCKALATAPALPVTTLARFCYNQMFRECTNLTTAPALPAETLADYCYQSMFRDCTSLNSITMLATNISASDCLQNWVSDVAELGTFYKNSDAIWDNEGVVPSGWTVQDYSVTP